MEKEKIKRVLCIDDYADCQEGQYYNLANITRNENDVDNIYSVIDKYDKEMMSMAMKSFVSILKSAIKIHGKLIWHN